MAAKGLGWGTAARSGWTAEDSEPPQGATVAAPEAREVAGVGAAEPAGLMDSAESSVAGRSLVRSNT